MLEIRPVAAEELADFMNAVSVGFGGDRRPEDNAPDRLELIGQTARVETLVAGADRRNRIMATLGSRDFDLTVPGGGTLAMAGTTLVTVRPNHRRQGVLTRMMSRHLHQAKEEGRPLAGLWASEETIYGRFGFGHACPRFHLRFRSSDVSLPAGPPDVELRYVDADEARSLLPPVYERARVRVAGHLTRSAAWWELRHFDDPEHDRDGASSRRFVLAERDGEASGYVAYRQRYDQVSDSVPDGTVEVHELVALDDGTRRALWHLLATVDLYPNVVHDNCPVDDPVLVEVARFRRLVTQARDSLWLRPLDVPAALTARHYQHDGSLVLRVVDPAGLADGTWRLEVSGGQAACTPVGPGGGGAATDAGVTLGVAELGALYLGGVPARTLARAGRIEGTGEAVFRLGALFRTVDAPHIPEVF